MSFQNTLPTSHISDLFDELPMTISQVDFWQWYEPTPQAADLLPVIKYELVDDIVFQPGLVKDDDALAAALPVTKASPEPFEWSVSSDLMRAVFGGDSNVAIFDIRLNSDIYLNANKETAVNIFPVVPFLALKLH